MLNITTSCAVLFWLIDFDFTTLVLLFILLFLQDDKIILLKLFLDCGRALELQLLPQQSILNAVNDKLQTLGFKSGFGSRCWFSFRGKPLRPAHTPLGLGVVTGLRQRRREAIVLRLHSVRLLGGSQVCVSLFSNCSLCAAPPVGGGGVAHLPCLFGRLHLGPLRRSRARRCGESAPASPCRC